VVRVPDYRTENTVFPVRYELSYLEEIVSAPVSKSQNTAVGIRHADHVAPSIRKKLALTSPTSGGRSVGIVRSQTQDHGVFLYRRMDRLCGLVIRVPACRTESIVFPVRYELNLCMLCRRK
jgi:hypothetical protein